MNAKFYENEQYVDRESGYTLRMNYSFTENFELHYHDYYEVFLTISGKTVQLVNGKKQILPEHSIVLIRSGDVHTYIKEGDFSFVNLTFNAETMENLCRYFGNPLENAVSQKMPPTVVLQDNEFHYIMKKIFVITYINIL